MKTTVKYTARDNAEFFTELECAKHEQLLDSIDFISNRYLGAKHPKVDNNTGYFQHRESAIRAGWAEVIKLARPQFKGWEKLEKAEANEIHPMGFAGRVISDGNSSLWKIWQRFSCIDDKYREWQQPYFAIHGPDKDNNKQVN